MKEIHIHPGVIHQFGSACDFYAWLDQIEWEKANPAMPVGVVHHEQGYQVRGMSSGESSLKGAIKRSTNRKERRRANRDPECIPCHKVFSGYID